MALSETAKLIAQLVLQDKLTPGVGKALGSVGKLESGMGRAAKGAGQLSTGLLRVGAIGAGAAVAGIAGAGKAAIDFEDAFAGIKKTVDETELAKAHLSFDDIKKSMLDLSTTIPITAVELARLGEAAGALGVRAQDIDDFAEVTAKLGATTNLTSDEAANSLGKIGTILGLTGKKYEDFADVLVNLGNKGASTESEIIEVTKRFAAAGKSAGLSTPQILGFASAISSAGVEPEAAGSSLSRLFGNLVQQTALGTAKAKAFAKASGKSFKDFSKIVKTDTNAAMLGFLKNLGKLDKFDQAKVLKSVGITNVRDINAIRLLAQTYDKNLIPALKNATDSAGALDAESTKKFDTLKQKWILLKNAFVKGGIEMGDGFLPALGRLTTKVTAWVNTNSGQLQQVGKDIGKALDDIDWGEVERGAKTFATLMKTALDYTKLLFDAVNALPTEIKAAGLGLIGLNKLSGGLIGAGIGNAVGGIGETLTRALGSKLPGVGKLFTQPVFVTNFPPGFGGGGGGATPVGAGGGMSKAGKALAALSIVGEIAAVVATQQEVSSQNSAIAADIHSSLTSGLEMKTPAELRTALAGVDQGIKDLTSNPLNVLVQGDALDHLKQMHFDITTRLKELGPGGRAVTPPAGDHSGYVTPSSAKQLVIAEKTAAGVAAIRDKVEASKLAAVNAANQTKTATVSAIQTMSFDQKMILAAQSRAIAEQRQAVVAATGKAESAARSAGMSTVAAMARAAAVISATIIANRPVVQATTVIRTTTVNNRYGEQSGSRNTGAR